MKKGYSYSVTADRQDISNNLKLISGKWNSNIEVKYSDGSVVSDGPVDKVRLDSAVAKESPVLPEDPNTD